MNKERQRKAVSIKYDPSLPAPFVSAKAKGLLAARMVEIAEEAGVPVVTTGQVSDDLFFLNPGELIPEYLFAVVAEILAFIYSVQEA